MRTPLDTLERRTGAFLIVVVVLLVGLGAASLGRSGLLGALRPRLLLYTMAEDSAGVAVGSPVRLHDVEIGSVSAIGFATRPEFPGKGVQLTLRIEPDAAPLVGADAIAIIGGGMAPFVTWGVTIKTKGGPPIQSGTYVKGEVLPSLMGDAGGMMVDVRRILVDLDAVLLNAKVLTDRLAEGKGVAGRMLTDEKIADDIQQIVRDAREATAELKQISAAVTRATPEIPGLLASAKQAGESAKSAAAKADRALDAVPPMIASVERTLAKTEETIGTARTSSLQVPEMLRHVAQLLDDAHRIMEALERNMIVRSTLSERPQLSTGAAIRPDSPTPASSAAR